jgi:eukaryotic-like serine/threonine-protein kinase
MNRRFAVYVCSTIALLVFQRTSCSQALPPSVTEELEPRIVNVAPKGGGRLQMQLAHAADQQYRLQCSADLSHWRNVAPVPENACTGAPLELDGGSSERCFYRLAREATMFRFGAQHAGVCDTAGPATLPELKWKFKTGGPVFSSPAVVGGVVFIGSLDTNLYALDAESGVEKWRVTTGGPIRSSPAVVDGSVYCYSRDGFVYALMAAAGHEIWRCKIAELAQTRSFDDYEYFDSSPTWVDGMIYIGSGDKNLYAINAQNGQVAWTFLAKSKISSPPAVAEGVAYFGVTDGNFYAVDTATGTNLWSFKTRGNPNNGYPKGDVLHAPVVLDGVVYFGSRDSAVYALDAATGKQKWRRDIMGGNNWAANSPAVHKGMGLLFIGSSITGALVALETSTGRQKWQFNTYSGLAEYSSPAIADGIAYIGIGSVQVAVTAPALPKVVPGYVQAVDLATQKEKWRLRFDGQVWSSPAVVDGSIYFGCLDGYVYSLK